jgi:hypothetical protein
MRIEVFLNPVERKRIRKFVKHIPVLKSLWDRSQAYLWTSVRAQKASKYRSPLPDFYIHTK